MGAFLGVNIKISNEYNGTFVSHVYAFNVAQTRQCMQPPIVPPIGPPFRIDVGDLE